MATKKLIIPINFFNLKFIWINIIMLIFFWNASSGQATVSKIPLDSVSKYINVIAIEGGYYHGPVGEVGYGLMSKKNFVRWNYSLNSLFSIGFGKGDHGSYIGPKIGEEFWYKTIGLAGSIALDLKTNFTQYCPYVIVKIGYDFTHFGIRVGYQLALQDDFYKLNGFGATLNLERLFSSSHGKY